MGQEQGILPADTQQVGGKNAQRTNILAAKLVAETVRSTLGPKGMDKMLVSQMGDVVVTNDGVTILEEIAVEHPTAKMIVEVARTQEDEVGDGTTSAVVIAGELLVQAEELLDKKIHPTLIVKGYRAAAQKAVEAVNSVAKKLDGNNTLLLEQIASTAMTGKGAEIAGDFLARLVVQSVQQVAKTVSVDKVRSHIRVKSATGKEVTQSEYINGILIDKGIVHASMPKKVENAKILLLNIPVEIRDTETDAKISITDPSQLDAYLAQEEQMLKRTVEMIVKSGASVVFCQKGIDDLAQYYLAKAGIAAVRRVRKSDIDALVTATGAQIVTQLHELSPQQLGNCDHIEQVTLNQEEFVVVSGAKQSDVATLLLYGGTQHIVAEVQRAVEDVLGDVSSALSTGKVVAGAGAIEISVANIVRKYADSLEGREQMAVRAFADAIEVIPTTLAENAGLDPLDVLTSLKSAHTAGKQSSGVNVFDGKVIDAFEKGIIEPSKIKTQAISSATEVATMILRIDDIIAAGPAREQEMQ